MTIAQAFNEIAVEHGGTASKSGSITDAIDALNDALAGSDQAPAQTIEQAVRLLGQNIGGGGGGAGFPVIEADADTGALSVTAGELKTMLDESMVLIKPVSEDEYIWAIISGYIIAENAYIFPSLVVGVTGAEAAPYKADTIDDYPEPFVIGG